MSSLLLGLVGLIYVYVAVEYFIKGNLGMGVAFTAYAVSNVGFIIANQG